MRDTPPNPPEAALGGPPAFRPDMAFPVLTPEMVDRLQAYGEVHTYPAAAPLFARGEREVDMFVVLEGTVEVYGLGEYNHDDDEPTRKLLASLGPRNFTGEIDLLSSRRVLLDGWTLTDCTLLRIPRSELQRVMRSEGDIANLIMQATIWRRLGIIQSAAGGIVVLGSALAADTMQLQRFLTRNGYPFRLVEPTAELAAECVEITHDDFLMPALILPDGRVLHRPTLPEVADELGLSEILDPAIVYDLTVVGAGPSGLATAVYAASEGLSTLVIESIAPGGQAGTSSKIENYLGFPTGVSGQELATRAQMQAQKFGARLAIAREAVSIDQHGLCHEIKLAGGVSVRSRSVVVATGAQYRKLAVENYARFESQGIHYACPAELPPPITITSALRQRLASMAVQA